MRELVGLCSDCKKEIYCLDGFFYGIQTDDKQIICFECNQKNSSQEEENPQS